MKALNLLIVVLAMFGSQKSFGYASETVSSGRHSIGSPATLGSGEYYLSWIASNQRCGIKTEGQFTGDELPKDLVQLCGEKSESAAVKAAISKYKLGTLQLKSPTKNTQVAGFIYGIDAEYDKNAFKTYKCREEARLGADGNRAKERQLFNSCMSR
jgi:hypothetical protein